MAISIDWPTKVINVPKADLTLIQSSPTEIRQLDIDTFRLELKSIEAGEGIPFLDTHNHNPPVTVGGVTLARVVEIINGYSITFEDDQYAVNLVGANSNIGDVVNVNQVSVRSANSAGLTDVAIQRKLDYEGTVWLTDDSNATSGTLHPTGTRGNPVDNINDALTIAVNNGINTIHAVGEWTFDSSHDVKSYYFDGSKTRTKIHFDSNVNTMGIIMNNVYVDGIFDGKVQLNNCLVGDTTNLRADMYETGLLGTVTYDSNAVTSILVDCFSAVAGDSTPELDLNNTNIN